MALEDLSLNDRKYRSYGTIATGTTAVYVMGAFSTGLGTFVMGSAGSAGTVANTFEGVSRGFTFVTPALTGTGTATLYLTDSLGGTMIEQAQVESGTTYYGTIVPMTTDMTWTAVANGTQAAAATASFAVHYEK